MKEEIIKFTTAKLAKEKGFDVPTTMYWYTGNTGTNIDSLETCNGFYNHNFENLSFSAPTQALLQRWLREDHEIIISIMFELESYECYIDNGFHEGSSGIGDTFETYEEALEDGLKEALTHIK